MQRNETIACKGLNFTANIEVLTLQDSSSRITSAPVCVRGGGRGNGVGSNPPLGFCNWGEKGDLLYVAETLKTPTHPVYIARSPESIRPF